eukprot:gene9475-12765_t
MHSSTNIFFLIFFFQLVSIPSSVLYDIYIADNNPFPSFHQLQHAFYIACLTINNLVLGFSVALKNIPINRISSKQEFIPFFQQYETKNTKKIHSNSRLYANPRKIDVGESSSSSIPKELMQHSLLTASDEFELSRQFKLGENIKAQSRMMSQELDRKVNDDEVAAVLEITVDQMKELLEKAEAAKKVLVRANMRLVFHISRYYRYRGIAYPDLVQEGTFGLIKAVDKYDPDRGFRFSTYASWWIKQAVSRAIAEKSRIIRLPVHVHDMMVSISKVEKQFIRIHSRKPTSQELSDRLALPLHKVELLRKCAREVNSIDEDLYQNRGKMSSNNELQVKDRLASQTIAQPTSLNQITSVRSELRRAMLGLSDREAQIVEMRFGLADGSPMTLEEIGKQFNVTRERIRQIEARALAKMRNPVKVNELRELFFDQGVEVDPSATMIVTPNISVSTPMSIM